jgi:putative ABC transport system permease protein
MGVFALVALALASVGLYGVVAHSVARRTQEIGVRMSLGARPVDVMALVIRQGMRPVMAGAVVGAGGTFAVGNGLKTFLFNVAPTDPATFLGVALVLVSVSLAACWLPARRASRVDPLIALRDD